MEKSGRELWIDSNIEELESFLESHGCFISHLLNYLGIMRNPHLPDLEHYQ